MRSIRFTSLFVTVKVILNLQIHTETGSVGCHRFTFFYVSGQFLVDSEARLKSVLGSMSAPSGQEAVSSPPKEPAAVGTFTAKGKVEDADAEGVTISHGPVPALKWPSMTMGFGKTKPTDFPGLKTGDTIQFQFKKGGAMGWELLSVEPTGAKK